VSHVTLLQATERIALHRRSRWATRLACCALLTLCSACAEGSSNVTRMANGVRYEGRFISPEAYADYTIGIEHETRGEYGKALVWYAQARSEDPESPEIWARIGAVQCSSVAAQDGPGTAAHAFDNGLRLDSDYYGNYFERARCEERARDFNRGLADAMAAVARRPGDEPANLLVARLLQALGRSADARLWLEAFDSFRDASPAMKRALEAARKPNAANASSQAADGAAAPLNAPGRTAVRSAAFAELRAGELESARKRAETELGADPSNSDAWVAALVACDALRDNACFDSALAALRTPSLPPSDTALLFLSDLLARRTGATVSR
jgi:tetratricopeptide (TPR) repeat protein